jgi:hypothetical protein
MKTVAAAIAIALVSLASQANANPNPMWVMDWLRGTPEAGCEPTDFQTIYSSVLYLEAHRSSSRYACALKSAAQRYAGRVNRDRTAPQPLEVGIQRPP